jgi:signal transduction histidine kinase
MDSQYTAAMLVTPETGALDPLVVVGLSPTVETRWWKAMRGGKITDFLPPDLVERLYEGDVLTFDLANQPPISDQDYFGVQQALAAAVGITPQQACLLSVEIRNHPTFTPAEKELVQAAVRLMALVLERDQLLRERAAAQARALASEETARRMDEFLGIASHELKNPLTSIKTNVDLARRRLNAATRQADQDASMLRQTFESISQLLTRADRQITFQNRLVSDLIDTTRIQAGKLELRKAPADLYTIVREAVEEQRHLAPTRAIHLDLPEAEPLLLPVDADRIGQVVTNYLSNALKYSDPEQEVAVLVTSTDTEVRVAVRDRGAGLRVEDQEHIWERFYRAPDVQVRSGSGIGLGLGLHICQTIIQEHGGCVGVESVKGEGSTFWFTLPKTAPAPNTT